MPIELLKMKIMLLFFIFWNIQSGKAINVGKADAETHQIYGGKEVIPNQYPWVLKLDIYVEERSTRHNGFSWIHQM